jgi:hypothetical protein
MLWKFVANWNLLLKVGILIVFISSGISKAALHCNLVCSQNMVLVLSRWNSLEETESGLQAGDWEFNVKSRSSLEELSKF